MKNKRVHVISRGKKWGVVKEDKSRASKLYDEKEAAINHATGLRKEEGYEVVIHREDGTVEEWAKNVDGNTVRFRRKSPTGGVKDVKPCLKKPTGAIQVKVRIPKVVRKCQRCGGKLKKAGDIRAGPKGGLRNIYFCTVCGFKSFA